MYVFFFNHSTRYIVYEEGDVVELRCRNYYGCPVHEYQWLINFLPLENETSASLNHTIELGEGYGGRFTCIVSNPAGSASGYITVFTRPVIVIPPMDTNVFVGGDVNLTCTAIGYPAPSYQWRKVNGSLPQNCRISINDGTSTLSLYSVDLEDNGEYNCTAIGYGYSVSESAVLTGETQDTLLCIP